jgi:hypothetical protein
MWQLLVRDDAHFDGVSHGWLQTSRNAKLLCNDSSKPMKLLDKGKDGAKGTIETSQNSP